MPGYTVDFQKFLLFGGLLIASCSAQLHAPTPPPTSSSLQQCAANLACSIDYNKIFQAKLDNVSHYTELEISLFRHQVNNILQPLQAQMVTLEANTTVGITALNNEMRNVEKELVHDREFLGNLTRGMYILNDDFHKESSTRYQDVHNLALELGTIKQDMALLQSNVNKLLGLPVTLNTSVSNPVVAATGSSVPLQQQQPCTGTVQDAYVKELEQNMTYYRNAYVSSEKALTNIRALESFLQAQVVQLKGNLTKVQAENGIKDNIIVHLQQQMQNLLNSPSLPPLLGNCISELGMKSGAIPDTAITGSASQQGYGPEHARIDNPQGWYTPERQSSGDWLQIDTGSVHYITKIATQGAPCCDVMVTNYTVEFSEDGQKWKEYEHGCTKRSRLPNGQMLNRWLSEKNNSSVFRLRFRGAKKYLNGNSDKDTVVVNTLEAPILGRFIKLNVVDFKKNGQSNYIGMRVELYGCTAKTASG